MKTFTIEASGKSLQAAVDAIKEALRHIEDGYWCGADSADDGSYHFNSTGEFENDQ